MGLRDQMRERERKSLARYGISNVMDHVVAYRDKLAAEDPAKNQKQIKQINDDLQEASTYVLNADGAYEIVSRTVKMLQQMLDGEWPKEELPGVKRALETVRKQLL